MWEYTVLVRGNLKIELEYIGEGWNGDYDPDNPDDEKLLRFTCLMSNESEDWEQIDDASYCTRLPESISDEEAEKALRILMEGIENRGLLSIKKECERLSWIGIDWLKEGRK